MNCIEINGTKDTFNCEMCGTYKRYAPHHFFIGHGAAKTLTGPVRMKVCQHCAMREEFGNKYKQSKRYKKWIESQS